MRISIVSVLSAALIAPLPALPQAAQSARPVAFNVSYAVTMSVDASKAAPRSAADRALVKAASALGTFELGKIADSGTVDGARFNLRSIATGTQAAKLLLKDDKVEIVRLSQGRWQQGQLATTRFTDRRGSAPPLVFIADPLKKRYELRRGSQVAGGDVLRTPVIDIAALPYMSLGRTPPAAPLTVNYTDGKSVKTATFRVAAESLAIAGTTVATTHLTAEQKSAADPQIEIWLRQADGFPLRVLIGFSAEWGATADQRIERLPPLVSLSKPA